MSFNAPKIELSDQSKIVFEKAYREPSSLNREGANSRDGNSSIRFRRPAVKDTARFMKIPITNDMAINEKGQIVKAQYIPGAPTIFVEDYIDADGKSQKGLKSLNYDLKEEYRKVLANFMGKLAFNEQGYLFLNTLPEDPQLVYFLMTHSFNQDWKFNKKPVLMGLRFKQYKREELNRKDMDVRSEKQDWMKFAMDLSEKTKGGYKYNEIKITAIAKIVGVDTIALETADRFNAIYDMINVNLKQFLNVYQPAIDETLLDLGTAVKLGIVSVNEKEAKLIDNKKPSPICSFEKGEGEIEGLAFYLWGTTEGAAVYSKIRDLVTTAQMEIVARG